MHAMSHPTRRLAVLAAACLAVLAVAAPVTAKESVTATLDAPIGMDTPGGVELLVGMTVVAPDEDGIERPVIGTPMYLKLFGRDGSMTRAAGAADHEPGHYTMRIEVPAGGARRVEVGIHGTSDLRVMVAGEQLVFGGITAQTAQLAPPLVPAPTLPPRATAPAVAASAAAPAAAAAPGPLPPAMALAAVALVALAVALVALAVRARVGRRTRTAAAPGARPLP